MELQFELVKPFPVKCDSSQIALIVIDMQRDFLEKGGFAETKGLDLKLVREAIPGVKILLDVFRDNGLCVIHTKEAHKADLSDCPPAKRLRGNPTEGNRIGDKGPMGRILISGEPGNDIIDEVYPEPGEIVLEKPGKGAFYKTDLENILQERGITHLLITGVTTEVCCQTTMREANDRGFECIMVQDATSSSFPRFKQAVLDMIVSQNGIVGYVASTSDILQAFPLNSHVIAVATVTIDPNHLDEFQRVIRFDEQESLKEPGCLTFVVWESNETPNEFTFYQIYKSLDALSFHKSTPHFNQWFDFQKQPHKVTSYRVKTHHQYSFQI